MVQKTEIAQKIKNEINAAGITIKLVAILMVFLVAGMPATYAIQIAHIPQNNVDLTMNSADISWTTDINGNSTINWGSTSGELNGVVSSSSMSSSHELTISGLSPSTSYYYSLTSCSSIEDCATTGQYSFATLDSDDTIDVIAINSESEANITTYSAEIFWNTDILSDSTVYYAETETELQNSPQEVHSGLNTLHHNLTILGLLSGMTYHYFVKSVDGNGAEGRGEVRQFQTLVSPDDFLFLNSVNAIQNNNEVRLSGISRPGRVMVYINRQDDPAPDYNFLVSETAFEETVHLDTARIENGIIGLNNIEVVAWDTNGAMDSWSTEVIIDTLIPSLQVSPLPEYTNLESLNISGLSEIGATITLSVNQNPGSPIATDANSYFETPLTLGQEGNKTIIITARDTAGNENVKSYSVVVDRTPPDIDFETQFGDNYHSAVLRIKGESDPHARIIAMNLGEFADINQYRRYQSGEITEQDLAFSLSGMIGLALGREMEGAAGSDGRFEVVINLIPPVQEGVLQQNNKIYFSATDRAGNIFETYEMVHYAPGCLDWQVGSKVDTYPYMIYSDLWHSNNIEASVLIPIEYMGPEDKVKVSEVSAFADGSTKGDNEQLSSIGKVKSWYNNREGIQTAYVQVPLVIGRTSMSNDDIERTISKCGVGGSKQSCLEFNLKIDIPYTQEGVRAGTCSVYSTVAYNVELPKNILDFMSPKALNDTIKWLGNAADEIDKMNEIVMTASVATLGLCVGSIVADTMWRIFKGLPQQGCTSALSKRTYYICDRVMCPDVNTCDFKEITPVQISNTDNGAAADTWGWVADNGAAQHVTAYTYTEAEASTDSDLRRAALNCKTRALAQGQVTGYILDYSSTESTIDPSSSIIENLNSESTGANLRDSQVTRRVFDCTFQPAGSAEYTGVDFSPASSTNGPGCYNEKCPEYDGTKCLANDFANKVIFTQPTKGIVSSTMCGCLPGMYGHLENAKTMLEGAQMCLSQAQMGEAMGGLCERLLAVYVCDIFIDVIGPFILKVPQYASKDSMGNRLGNPAQVSRNIGNELRGRYGGMLTTSGLGLSTENVANKMCIAGITGDWSDIEQAFQGMVESIEIDPVVHIEADSFMHGFDATTGLVSIAYSVGVGIIPGGEMKDIKLYLECDRSKTGGNMCGAEKETHDLTISRTLQRGDNLNEDKLEIVEESHYWYNNLVIEYKFKKGNEYKSETKEVEINKKGGLGYNCDFSLLGGITCGTNDLFENGYLELKKDKIHLSPNVNTYYRNNIVNAIVPMRNDFNKPFLLVARITAPGGGVSGIKYTIPAKKYANQEVVYNLPMGSVVGIGSNVDSYRGETILNILTSPIPVNDKIIKIEGKISGGTGAVTLIAYGSGNNPINTGCTVSSNEMTSCQEFSEGQEIYKITAASQIPGQTVIVKLSTSDGRVLYNDGTMVAAAGAVEARLPTIPISSQATASPVSGTWKIELQPFYEDEGGIFPILYSADNQIKPLTYSVGQLSVNNERPAVEIVEPTGDFVPGSNSAEIPIGINVVDDKNDIKRIIVRVFEGILPPSKEEASSACSLTIKLDNGKTVLNPQNFVEVNGKKTDSCIISLKNDRPSRMPAEDKIFQYFSFDLTLKDELIQRAHANNLDTFIYVEAYDMIDSPQSKITGSKRIAIAPIDDSELTAADITLCHGGSSADLGGSASGGGQVDTSSGSWLLDCLEYVGPVDMSATEVNALFSTEIDG